MRHWAVLAAVLGTSVQAHALTFTTPLDFVAGTQSLWGSGSGANFGNSNAVSLGIVEIGYNIGASTGTVSGQFQGDMSVSYADSLSVPGTTSLNLSFLGDPIGGRLTSDLGAWAHVYVGPIDIVNEDYALNINEVYAPQVGQQVSGSDSATVGSAGIGIPFIAEVGADFDIEQTDTFKATTIDGALAYSLRGSGAAPTLVPFSLTTDAGLTLDLGLNEVGTWDFWFVNMMLENAFATSFDAQLVLYEEHIGCGFLGLELCRNDLTLADIDVYNGSPFALAFNSIDTTSAFSIEVASAQVPEPPSLPLLAMGLAIMLVLSIRGRRTAGRRSQLSQ
jgi:hypothetical protein